MSTIGARLARLEVVASGADSPAVVQASWTYQWAIQWDNYDPNDRFDLLCGIASVHDLSHRQVARALVLACERVGGLRRDELADVAAAAESDPEFVFRALAGIESGGETG